MFSRIKPVYWLWFAIFGFLLIRLGYLYTYPYPLYADEAQYWFWAQYPDWGYYSKPPVMAWAIAATSWLVGEDTAFAIKLASPLCYAVTSYLVYRIGRAVGMAEVAAVWAGVVFCSLPGVTLSSSLISTDPFLLLFWAWFMLAFWHAVHGGGWRWWLMAGLAGGFGLMSKYNMAFVLVAVLAVAVTGKGHVFRQSGLYLGGAVAALIFAPNIWWNIQHGMASFQHTGDITQLSETGVSINLIDTLEFIGAQAALLGPVVFLALLVVLGHWRQWRGGGTVYLLWFFLPVMLAMVGLSLATRAHGNWAAPALVPAVLLAVHWLVQHRRWLVVALVLHLLVVGVYYRYEPLLQLAGVELSKPTDPFRRLRGWDEVGKQVKAQLNAHPEAMLLTDRRKVSALLAYYAGDSAKNLVAWQQHDGEVRDHFQLMRGVRQHGVQDQPYLLVTPDPAGILPCFDEQRELPDAVVQLASGGELRLKQYWLRKNNCGLPL